MSTGLTPPQDLLAGENISLLRANDTDADERGEKEPLQLHLKLFKGLKIKNCTVNGAREHVSTEHIEQQHNHTGLETALPTLPRLVRSRKGSRNTFKVRG